jgi:hypothetical protein
VTRRACQTLIRAHTSARDSRRKISEPLIDFGAPLIGDLDEKQPIEIVRAVFGIVITSGMRP